MNIFWRPSNFNKSTCLLISGLYGKLSLIRCLLFLCFAFAATRCSDRYVLSEPPDRTRSWQIRHSCCLPNYILFRGCLDKLIFLWLWMISWSSYYIIWLVTQIENWDIVIYGSSISLPSKWDFLLLIGLELMVWWPYKVRKAVILYASWGHKFWRFRTMYTTRINTSHCWDGLDLYANSIVKYHWIKCGIDFCSMFLPLTRKNPLLHPSYFPSKSGYN
jgi:hypothetical protein